MSETKKPAALVAKLAKIMADLESVPKRGKNTVQNYSYATEADVAHALRSKLAASGVMMIPSVLNIEWREVAGRNGPIPMSVLTVEFTVTDGTDEIKFVTVGSGMDSGDKAVYKALTGANKYAMLKLFLFSTGDDPEKDDEEPPKTPDKPSKPGLSKEQRSALWAYVRSLYADDLKKAEAKLKDLVKKEGCESSEQLDPSKFEEYKNRLDAEAKAEKGDI